MAVVDIAVAVGSAVGLEGTAAAIGGGALLGAGAGGLYGAATGVNVGQDMLMGGLLGGGFAYGAGALGFGSDATDALFNLPGSGATLGGSNTVAGNTVAGAVGAGPAPTTFTPGTSSLGAVYTVSNLGGASLN